jgi:hypothetical protein
MEIAMYLTVRTTTALLALTLFAGVGHAAPGPALADNTGLVISVVDDSTNEDDAIDKEQNKLSSPEDAAPYAPSPSPQSSSSNNENDVIDMEQNKSDN